MEITTEPEGDGHYTRYSWEGCTDGAWRLARAGTDYGDPVKFQTAGRIWATRRGFRWSHRTVPEGVKFRIWRPEA